MCRCGSKARGCAAATRFSERAWSAHSSSGCSSSAATRRPRAMPDSLLDGLPAGQRELLRPAEPPRSARLMKAVLHDEPFADPAWVFERKLDGIRCLAV